MNEGSECRTKPKAYNAIATASDFWRLLTLFVVTLHCKNSYDPVRFQYLVDEAMLKIDAS